jgi:signal transduction histidine kinase
MPRLFEPFVTHGKSHGTGLGMAIAKSVVEAHGGKISVASIEGSGTTVDIRLPAVD